MASTILELTVDATMASLPGTRQPYKSDQRDKSNQPSGFPAALYCCSTALAKSAPSWSPVNVVHLPSALSHTIQLNILGITVRSTFALQPRNGPSLDPEQGRSAPLRGPR